MAIPHHHSEHWRQLVSCNSALAESADKVLFGSSYVCHWGERYPARANELFNSGDVTRAYAEGDYEQRAKFCLDDVTDEHQLHQRLRHFRQREMVRIIWRDLAGWADLAETVAELSTLADACIQTSLALVYEWQCQAFGVPYDNDDNQQYLVVLAMGKLGAGELNLSSDVDLIFTYPSEGHTTGGRRSLSNDEFFTRLGRKLIQALDNVTVDGFVFRVDMRLRPFGDSGGLAISFDAIEDYYQTQGREWERYAMIKARPITGREHDQTILMGLLKPFIYRRYLDYGVFASLREMKAMIAGQLHQKGMEDNIKLGAGGIREIEFIGQVFQLIYGGRDIALQQRPILSILALLAQRGHLSDYAVNDLKQAYTFLRCTEHRIQAWADQQTHVLPKADADRNRIAVLMGCSDWHQFSVKMAEYRQHVQSHFEQLLTAPQADDIAQDNISLFTSDQQQQLLYLNDLGYCQPVVCLERLHAMLTSHNCRHLSETGHKRLVKLLPLLVQAAAQVNNADACLLRVIPLVEAIMRRSAYMSLLVENPLALSQLIRLCAASVWISHQLVLYPMLLDQLLDPRSLYHVPDRAAHHDELTALLASVQGDDLEQHMEKLREFRQVATLHVAAADISGVLPVMRVGDQLTVIAEIALEQIMRLAWQHIVARHGYPVGIDSDDLARSGFTILAYGKFAGLELGYGSDLDLVFIYNDVAIEGFTNGDKPVDILVFYTRLAQRMIHVLNTTTRSGILYEVDTRLRPNGRAGLLVTGVSGFADYQQQDAWTWEHQALVRARCIVGDAALSKKVNDIRRDVLAKQRDLEALRIEVCDMRAKMRAQLDKTTAELFDLKQGDGGITDIEFMVQYAVLAWSVSEPELLSFTDTIRILDALYKADKLDKRDADMLAEAYRFYRHLANHCVLEELPAVVPFADVASYQPRVSMLWQRWFG